jgi:methanogenic corrinoid protein MtbC1
MTATALERITASLESLGHVSPAAAAGYTAAFARTMSVVEERCELEAARTEQDVSPDDVAFLRDSAEQFGHTLGAVYRFSLWDALAGEAADLAWSFRSRNLGTGDLSWLLGAWMMAILSAVNSPEARELTRPLDILRKEIDILFEAASLPSEAAERLGPADTFVASLLSGSPDEAVDQARAYYERTGSMEDVVGRLLFAGLVDIGRLWGQNRIGVAEEHAATATLRAATQRFFDSFPARRTSSMRVAITCVPGDEHELGAEILARYLSWRGWPVYFIGHSSPEGEIFRVLERDGYGAVLLSVSMIRHLPALASLAGRLRRQVPSLRIVAGGGAIGRAEAVAQGIVDAIARTPAEAHEVLVGLEQRGA